jgi:hypothetical protein
MQPLSVDLIVKLLGNKHNCSDRQTPSIINITIAPINSLPKFNRLNAFLMSMECHYTPADPLSIASDSTVYGGDGAAHVEIVHCWGCWHLYIMLHCLHLSSRCCASDHCFAAHVYCLLWCSIVTTCIEQATGRVLREARGQVLDLV